MKIRLAILGTWFAAAVAMPAWSQESTARSRNDSSVEAPANEHILDIPRVPLKQALTEFCRQTGLTYGQIPDTPEEEAVIVGPLKGSFTADAALLRLFAGTPLTFQWIAANHFAVNWTKAGAEKLSDSTSKRLPRSSWGTGLPGDVESVIVSGTRLSSIAREAAATAVIGRRKIESYGVSTLAELFEYLPQIPFVRSEDYRTTGEQYVDLRGFGPGTTLILINGRRVAASAMSFDTGGFDINTVPLSAVKRIEVLLDSPSIAIGADAVGGVINLVLKDDIPAPLVQARYGAAAGGAAERRASLGLGTSREVFRGAVTLDVFDRDFLLGSERDLTRNQDYRRFGARDARSPIASPPNISSLTGANLPGLPYSFAAVPIGSTGVGLTPNDFLATAGQRNLTSWNRYRSIVPATTRASVIASGEISRHEDVVGFAELFATHHHHEFQFTLPMLGNAVVPSSNPYNPFGVPVVASALLQGIGPTTFLAETTLVRGVLGARTKWHKWEGEIAVTWHQEDARHWREHELDPLRIAQALASSDAASALNLFVDGPAGQPELLDSLQAPRRTLSFGSNTAQAYVRAQGPIATLPAGEVMITVGSEWRREGLSTLELSTLHREASSAFAEVRIPLVSAEMHWPALDYLEFSSGIRGDGLGDLGTTLSAQYGLVWRPAPHLKMRASYSDTYRPPSLYDLHSPRFTAPPFFLPDPRRNNELASFVVHGGGNPDLVPTFGQSWTVGLEFAPSERLRASAGYWHTTIMDRIVPMAIPLFVNHEDLFPGRVVRAEPTVRDIELGMSGALLSVDASPGNFGSLEADGVDGNLAFSWNTRVGRMESKLAATWNHSFRTTIVSGLEPQERAGVASDLGTIPKWRAVASVDFKHGPVGIFSALRFTSGYDDAFLGIKNGRSIPASLQLDARVSIQLDTLVAPHSIVNGIKLAAGAINLFDEAPPYSQVFGDFAGYDATQASLRQRFWYLTFEKEF